MQTFFWLVAQSLLPKERLPDEPKECLCRTSANQNLVCLQPGVHVCDLRTLYQQIASQLSPCGPPVITDTRYNG